MTEEKQRQTEYINQALQDKLSDADMVRDQQKMINRLQKHLTTALKEIRNLEEQLGKAHEELDWYEEDGE